MSWIERQISELVTLNEKAMADFGSLGADLMDLKPAAKSWSINECLDHLVQSNQQYFGIFDAITDGTYKDGKGRHRLILPRLMGKMVLKIVSPNYKGKNKTAPLLFPVKSTYGSNLTQGLLDSNEVLIEKLKKCKPDDLDEVIVISPVSRFVTYSLRDCIQLLVSHEQRHYGQALDVKGRHEKTGERLP